MAKFRPGKRPQDKTLIQDIEEIKRVLTTVQGNIEDAKFLEAFHNTLHSRTLLKRVTEKIETLGDAIKPKTHWFPGFKH